MNFRERRVGQSQFAAPRNLNKDEVEMIVAVVPYPEIDEPISREISREVILSDVRAQLFRIKLVPHEAAIKRMMELILKRFNTAKIIQGSRVGLFVADALGATSTQITLDTFKLIGVSSIGNGIKGFKNLLYLPLNRSDPSMMVHFLMDVNRSDVIEMRSLIEAVTVEHFVKRFQIGAFSRSDRPETDKRRQILSDPDEVIILESKWWHSVYDSLNEPPSYYPAHIMRIFLDTQKMYEHRVTMEQLSRALKNYTYEKVGLTDVIEFDVVTSPFEDGILDIIPRKTIELIEGVPYPVRTFLYNLIRPNLRKIHIKGIPGVTKLSPVTIDLKRSVLDKALRRPRSDEISDVNVTDMNLWVIPINRKFMHSKFINPRRLRDYLEKIDVIVVKTLNIRIVDTVAAMLRDKFNLALPPSPDRDLDAFLVHIPDASISQGGAVWKWIEQSWIQRGIKPEYTYAITTGDNLKAINRFSFVDTNRTITNNIREISVTYGVEAARDYYIFEFLEILREITDISSRNLTLLADFIFSYGRPLGIDFASESKRKKGGLAGAINAKFKQATFTAATYGKYESTSSIPIGLITGSRGPFEETDPNKIRKEIARLKLQREYRLNPDKFTKAGIGSPDQIVEPVKEESPADLIRGLGLLDFDLSAPKDRIIGLTRPEHPTGWPAMDLARVVERPVAMATPPPFYRASIQRYAAVVEKRLTALAPEERVPLEDQYTHNVTTFTNAIFTYTMFQAHDLDYSKFRRILDNNNMDEISSDTKLNYIDLVWVQSMGKGGFGDQHFRIQTYLKSIMAEGKQVLSDKQRLHENIKQKAPSVYARHVPATFDLKDDFNNFVFGHGEVYIIRPAGRVFFSAEGITVVDSIEGAQAVAQKLAGYKAIVSRYIKNPLLWQGKKTHLRVYFAIAKGPNVPGGYMWSVCNTTKIMTAKLPYISDDYGNEDIHDTHMFRTSQDLFFPDDLEVPVASEHTRESLSEHILRQVNEILESVALISQEDITIYPESTNGFEVFGVDMMVTDESENFNVYLIEINSHVGYGGLDSQKEYPHWNELTGPWTPKFSDFSERYFNWVYDAVINPIFLNKSIETRFVLEPYIPTEVISPVVATVPVEVVETKKRKMLPVPDWILTFSKENMLYTDTIVYSEVSVTDIRILEAYLQSKQVK